MSTPLPAARLAVVAWMNFSEALSFTMCLPFSPFMVQQFMHLEDDDPRIGYYSGVIIGMASLAEFLGSYPWGVLSDRIGRRPVLLAGLLSTTVCIPIFGFSTSFAMALSARSLRGLCNGNIGVTKTYLSEITDQTNRARAFGILTTCFGVGMLIGPALGGALSQPSATWPSAFPAGSLFARFPFALPCCLCGVCSAVASVVAWACLTETLPPRSSRMRQLGQPLLDPVASPSPAGRSASAGAPARPSALTWLCAAHYGVVAFAVAVVQEVWVLWAKLPMAEGGLRFDTRTIGLLQALGGAGILCSQLLLFPAVVRTLGLLRTYRWSWLPPVLAYALTPFTNRLESPARHADGSGALVPLLVTLGALQLISAVFVSSLFTCTMLFISNSAPAEALGAANGVGQTLACAARSVGPVLGGSLIAWLAGKAPPLDEHLAFFAVAALGALALALSRGLPTSIGEPLAAASPPSAGPRVGADDAFDDHERGRQVEGTAAADAALS